MEIKQQIKLSQQLVMTPQLQQAIRLLQLSRLELIDEIRKELDANPVLADDDIDPRTRAQKADATAAPENIDPVAMATQGEERIERMEDRIRSQEIDWEQFLENRTLQQPLPANRGGFEELPPIEASLTKQQSLVDHLRWQLQMSDFTEAERNFAELVLGNLDDNGFLDLKGTERDNGERTPDLTIEEM